MAKRGKTAPARERRKVFAAMAEAALKKRGVSFRGRWSRGGVGRTT